MKENNTTFKKILPILIIRGVLVIAAIVLIILTSYEKNHKFKLNSTGLGRDLPEPPIHTGKILTDNKNEFELEIERISQARYEKYVKKCKDVGYDKEQSYDESMYSAFTKDGDHLVLTYIADKSQLRVKIEKYSTNSELNWPKEGFATYVPTPPSKTGYIDKQEGDFFRAYISGISEDAFKRYVKACQSEAGYVGDSKQTDTTYYALDDWGTSLSLKLEANGVMCLEVSKELYHLFVQVDYEDYSGLLSYSTRLVVDGNVVESNINKDEIENYEDSAIKKGSHTLYVENYDGSIKSKEYQINVSQDTLLIIPIVCDSDKINFGDVKEYNFYEDTRVVPEIAGMTLDEAVAAVKNAGFTDVTYKAISGSVWNSSNWDAAYLNIKQGAEINRHTKIVVYCEKR